MFQFFKPPFSTKITNFTKFAVLEPKFTQNFHSKTQIWPKFSSLNPFFQKIQFFNLYFFPKKHFFKTLFLVPIRSLSPNPALQAAHLYQNESWVPPGMINLSVYSE